MTGASVHTQSENRVPTNVGELEFEKLTVQIFRCNGELPRREKHGNDPTIPEDADDMERATQPPQTPLRLVEILRREEDTAQRDQAVRSRRGNAGGGDQRREGDAGREDRAGDEGRDAPDYQDGVLGLAVGGGLGDPAGAGQDAITSDGEDETRGREDGDGGVL